MPKYHKVKVLRDVQLTLYCTLEERNQIIKNARASGASSMNQFLVTRALKPYKPGNANFFGTGISLVRFPKRKIQARSAKGKR